MATGQTLRLKIELAERAKRHGIKSLPPPPLPLSPPSTGAQFITGLAATVFSGLLRFYRGEPEMAIEHLARAMRLSPLDPTLY
jgi:hypothetical protein